MTASTRSLIWLATILMGILQIVPDPDGPVMAAVWKQPAAWDDADDDAHSPPDDLTHPHSNEFVVPPLGIQGGALVPLGQLLPAKRAGIDRHLPLSRYHTRPPPIA